VTAILGGLGAAACFAGATICSSRSSRLIGAAPVVGWMMLVGLAAAGPGAAAQGLPDGLAARQVGWLALAGAGNVAGLLLTYTALRRGKLGLVTPIVSTEGAVAALLSVAAGDSIGAAASVALVVITIGLVVASAPGRVTSVEAEDGRGIALALAAALCFGGSLFATGRVSAELPLFWAALPARLTGTVVVALPLAFGGRLRLSRRAAPLVVLAGLSEVGGFLSFGAGARDSIPVTAVLASQFATLAALFGYAFFGERLGRVRVAAVAVIVAGVAALSALQA
jgi:drug/metabolite transporter (DMT)-like permease